jgi:hypothetical protein
MFAALNRLRGKSFKTRLLNPRDELWDRRFGVRTFGYHPATAKQGDKDWRLHYQPVPYYDIFRLLRMVDLRSDDVFVDLGAGMGRAVFAASWMGARRALGVEIVQNLYEKAILNYRQGHLSGRDIQFICTNAINYRHHDTTVLFMFHPFGEATLRQVLLNVEADCAKRLGGGLRIIYLNPVFDAVLKQMSWLQCIGRVPAAPRWPSTAGHYQSTLWQSVP